MLLILLFLLFISFLGIIFAIFLFITIFTGAPYLASTKQQVENIIKLANFKKGEKIIDLGSGDGRIVIEFAKLGIDSYGIELNPFFVIFSKLRIKLLGLKNAHIIYGNLFKENLSKYDIIVCFGIKYMMDKLEKKIINETKPNVRIISNVFEFKNLKLKQIKESIRLYLI